MLDAASNSALGTGSVVIGAAGDVTTTKLEVVGSHTLLNNIDFRGRNNNSVGIESLSGNNVLSGTTSANVGGGTYQIQSDAGTLTLTGAAPAQLPQVSRLSRLPREAELSRCKVPAMAWSVA